MKKRCKYCGGNLLVFPELDKLKRQRFAFYCKNIECGRHNQYCKAHEVSLYEKKQIEQENIQDIRIHACRNCAYFRPTIKCGFTGNDEKYRMTTCEYYQDKGEQCKMV